MCSFWVFQGKLDALWALFRRGYDQVSLMRPHPGDEVSLPVTFCLHLEYDWKIRCTANRHND